MKTIHAILALIVATLFVSAATLAGAEPEIQHRIKLKIQHDDELVAIDAENMEVGETRQSYTESGKEVLFTRTEDGYRLEVDGEEIELDLPHGKGHHTMIRTHGGEDAKVIVRKFGHDCEHGEDRAHGADCKHGYAYLHTDDHHWVEKGEGGEEVHIEIERTDPADYLLESGVLDGLDEATRQKILDTLREMTPHKRIEKRVVVKVDEEVEEEIEDE